MSIKPETAVYAQEVYARLKEAGWRVDLDVRDENVKQKVKEHSLMVVPYIIAVGERDRASGTISVRSLGEDKPQSCLIANFIQNLQLRS